MSEKKLYTLTDEHRAQMKPWADKWIANAFRTDQYSDEQREIARVNMRGYYGAANLEAPKFEVFVASPITGAFAAGFSSGMWWLRENTGRHAELFKRVLTEKELRAGLDRACQTADKQVSKESTAVRLATRAACDIPLDEEFAGDKGEAELARFFLLCAQRWSNFYQGGAYWSGWVAWISFFRHIVKLDLDYSKWAFCETLSEFAPRFVHSKFWILSSFPEILKMDEQRRPHCPDGPSHRWSDGRELFYWRGTAVPKDWILKKGDVDPKLALTWSNIEQRRCLAEIIGWGKVIEQLKPRIVNQDADPQIGTLLEVDLPESGVEKFLQVKCATGRDFVLPVPPEMQTALEANAWTYSLDPKELTKLEKRT